MSEPVSDGEIEDVLSSIRRLISDDASRRAPEPRVMDRFVLTPALRVMDGDPAVTGDSDDSAEPNAAPVKPARAMPRNVEEAVSATARTELEERIAELEAAVSRSREEWEPDGSEPEAEELPERHIFAHSEPGEDQPEPSDAPSAGPVPTFRRDRAEAEAPEQPEAAEVGGDAEDAALPERSGAKGTGLAVVDDEALKELVAQVVRKELQGAMGERITRNVRRMVRREIQQALALKDFD